MEQEADLVSADNAAQVTGVVDSEFSARAINLAQVATRAAGPGGNPLMGGIRTLLNAFDAAPVAILLINPDGSNAYANHPFLDRTGESFEEFASKPRGSHTHPDDVAEVRAVLERLARGESDTERFVLRMRTKTLDYVQMDTTAVALRDPQGELVATFAFMVDITLQRQTDSLLRQDFDEVDVRAPAFKVARNRLRTLVGQGNGHIAVLALGLEGFDEMVRRYGPEAPERVLPPVAESMSKRLSSEAVLSRLRDDTFLVVEPEVAGEQQARALAGALLAAVSVPIRLNGRHTTVAASCGAVVSDSHISFDEAVRDALDCLSSARKQGAGTTHWADDSSRESARIRREIGAALPDAIRRGELAMRYQPLVSFRTGRMLGVESLVRWFRGDGAVSPAVFVPLAEELGMAAELGSWVAAQVAADVAAWSSISPLLDEIHVDVNISALQLRDSAVVASLRDPWAAHGLDPGRLVAELTETAAIPEHDRAAAVLQELTDSGIRLAIDDFGAGQAWFGHLSGFQPHIVKLDMIFARQVAADGADKLTAAAIAAGKAVGATVVAEGVATAGQAASFRRLGADVAQGFYYSQAVNGEELGQLAEHLALRARHRAPAGHHE